MQTNTATQQLKTPKRRGKLAAFAGEVKVTTTLISVITSECGWCNSPPYCVLKELSKPTVMFCFSSPVQNQDNKCIYPPLIDRVE